MPRALFFGSGPGVDIHPVAVFLTGKTVSSKDCSQYLCFCRNAIGIPRYLEQCLIPSIVCGFDVFHNGKSVAANEMQVDTPLRNTRTKEHPQDTSDGASDIFSTYTKTHLL
jgi:hypothetical protein